jgi:hypothetical protein
MFLSAQNIQNSASCWIPSLCAHYVSIMVHGREGTEHCNPWIAYYYTACLILKITSTMGMIVEVPIIFFFSCPQPLNL